MFSDFFGAIINPIPRLLLLELKRGKKKKNSNRPKFVRIFDTQTVNFNQKINRIYIKEINSLLAISFFLKEKKTIHVYYT